MATYQTKKCPSCGRTYEQNMYSGYPSKGNRIKYGSPFKQCQVCGTVFVDREYVEIKIEGIREVDKQRISAATMAYTIMGFAIGIVAVISGEWLGIIFVVIAMYLFASEYFEYNKRQEALEIETEMSRLRMGNPEYAQALKKNGFYVPDRYLSEEILKKSEFF